LVRYLFDFTVHAGGGSSTYARGFLQELASRPPTAGGCLVLLPADVQVLVAEERGLLDAGYIVRRAPQDIPGTWRSRLLRQLVIPVFALRFRATLVFAPRETAPLFTPRKLVILANNLAVWERGGIGRLRASVEWFVMHILSRAAAARATLVLATTNAFADRIQADRRKIRIVYHGCDLVPAGNPRVGTDAFASPLIVTCLGTVYPHKRYDVIVRAVHALRDLGVDACLTIFGDTSDVEETDRVRSLSMAELGYDPFVGELPADRRADALTKSDVLALGSSFESFCLPMVEAMRTSTLVWAPWSPLVRELCSDSCVTYREGDHMDAARQLVASFPRVASLIDEGQRRSERFTWKRCVDETLFALHEASVR
jgi:glycosyltransferase involved in cell wall biosynthesis